jgi:syntaxin of plants SYP5
MAGKSDPWVREYNEAFRLAGDISTMMSEKDSLSQSGPDAIRHISALRRKLTILGTRLDTLDSLLAKLPALKTMYAYSVSFFFIYIFEICMHLKLFW